MKHDEMIAIVLAHKEGSRIQYRGKWSDDEPWRYVSKDIEESFNFISCKYRIMPREWWIRLEEFTQEGWAYRLEQDAKVDDDCVGFKRIHVREVLEDNKGAESTHDRSPSA